MIRVAVVGAGIVGLAAAHALRTRGAEVTLYESGPPGAGQSAGQSRIFRHAHEDPRLIALAARSRELWRAWEREFGVELVSPDGAVAIGDGVEAGLRALEPFPQIPVRRTASGALEVRTGTTVAEHDHAVLCAGRGTVPLARGTGLDLPVELGAHVRLTFRTRAGAPQGLPTLQDGSGAFGETGAYAAPYPDGRHCSVGLSADTPAHPDGGLADPAELAALAERTVDYVRRALPGLDPRPVDHVHCWVTRLPWGDDGVGIWSEDGLTALAGHNLFKQAPALGEALAQTALTGTVPGDLHHAARPGRPRLGTTRVDDPAPAASGPAG